MINLKNNDSKVNYNNSESQCSKALKLLTEDLSAKFFRDENNNICVSVYINGNQETHFLRDSKFKILLCGEYFYHYNRALNKDVIEQVFHIISYQALYMNRFTEPVFNRVGFDDEGNFYYDLSNPDSEMVKISSDDYRLEIFNPVRFKRYSHQIPQVRPNFLINDVSCIDKIFKYIRINNFEINFICWIVSCFIPNIPHPVLIFHGEMGSAKSTAFYFIKRLVDPSVVETLTMPKDTKSLSVIMQNDWFLPFDNISHISEDMSDFLCRAVTGTAIQERKLHTNGDDYIFKFQNIIGLNGINQVALKPDLIDRSMIFELYSIPFGERKELSELKAEFENDLPDILGCIFKILANSIKYYKEYKLTDPKRMADFQRWGLAIARAYKGENGVNSFLLDYDDMLQAQVKEYLSLDCVAMLLSSYMNSREKFYGTMTELLIALKSEADRLGVDTRTGGFPGNARALSAKINEIIGPLEKIGISVYRRRTSEQRMISIHNENYKSEVEIGNYLSNEESEPNNAEAGEDNDDLVSFD